MTCPEQFSTLNSKSHDFIWEDQWPLFQRSRARSYTPVYTFLSVSSLKLSMSTISMNFFCSGKEMFDIRRKSAHESGIPCKEKIVYKILSKNPKSKFILKTLHNIEQCWALFCTGWVSCMYERLLKRGLCRPVNNILTARFEAISIDNMYCMLKQCIDNMHRIEFW